VQHRQESRECATFVKIAHASSDITHCTYGALARGESRGRRWPRRVYTCALHVRLLVTMWFTQGKTLTMCPRFIFEVNVRSRIYHINANAFLPSLRVRCGPLSILVLFAMKNGTRCGRNCKRERSTLYETIYGYLYSKMKTYIYGIHNLLQRNMHYIIYYSICHNVTYTVMYIIKSGGKVVRNLICNQISCYNKKR